MVIDTSVILAILFKEKHYRWAVEQLNIHARELKMSTINLAEVLILIEDRQPRLARLLESQILDSGIKFIAPDVTQAQLAARARLDFPLNLGDCFVYALAVQEDSPIMTLDKDFTKINYPLVMP